MKRSIILATAACIFASAAFASGLGPVVISGAQMCQMMYPGPTCIPVMNISSSTLTAHFAGHDTGRLNQNGLFVLYLTNKTLNSIEVDITRTSGSTVYIAKNMEGLICDDSACYPWD